MLVQTNSVYDKKREYWDDESNISEQYIVKKWIISDIFS